MCQGNLKVGDPIEVLANATASIEVKEHTFDFIYHPQNIFQYQWFEMGGDFKCSQWRVELPESGPDAVGDTLSAVVL